MVIIMIILTYYHMHQNGCLFLHGKYFRFTDESSTSDSSSQPSTFEYYNVYVINFIVLKVTLPKNFIWHAIAKNGTQ